ncbi:MAG: undecaprenyl-diphosphate phosphatase [Pleurocapsa minor GSE-CHR-MK-17-07R]|jgi:undecaprenyl-diphosphatase|nr:undecaprenyl-diphosphate phosphatase [Pleurocapsa minor GSE-CHR-MK 17-07R]
MLELIKVILLGIIEGVTEFLPISSTGHLIAAVAILRPAMGPGTIESFEIFIQLGAVVAVIAWYRADLLAKLSTLTASRDTQRFALALIVAFFPAAIIGVLTREIIKEVLFNPVVVAISLIVGGIALIAVERLPRIRSLTTTTVELETITPRHALIIGLLQTLALIPGVSRSAASIVGGMLTGLNRQTATAFSFYLAIPTLGLATIADLVFSLDEINTADLLYFFIGAVVAGIVAWLSIRWLLRYVATHTFAPFGVYRIIAGIILLILVATGIASQ